MTRVTELVPPMHVWKEADAAIGPPTLGPQSGEAGVTCPDEVASSCAAVGSIVGEVTTPRKRPRPACEE